MSSCTDEKRKVELAIKYLALLDSEEYENGDPLMAPQKVKLQTEKYLLKVLPPNKDDTAL